MIKWLAIPIFLLLVSCQSVRRIDWPERSASLGGTEFYKRAFPMQWSARDSFAVQQIFSGNVPGFLKVFQQIKVEMVDSSSGQRIRAAFYVSPDYLSVGTDVDWTRIPLTPMAAQRLADSLDCFLPTRKIVDDIYRNARVKLEPVPLYAYRDSTPTMWHHHLIIEGQRQGRSGLIAGIKKDVVISGKISRDPKPHRVAIYGWHKPGRKPIQPLYSGHVHWYVDYSHGIRLVWRKIRIHPGEGKGWRWMDYTEVLQDPRLRRLLCDEEYCDFFRYDF